MKKIYLTAALAFLFSFTGIKAQVGVGIPTPDASAMLDVSSTNKGLLIPRIALTGTGDNTTIASPQTSLLVYNTATASSGTTAVTPGFYYWNGSAWERLLINSNVSASTWGLSGNAGTNPAANFIGTTDNKPLVFKINNVLAGKLSTDIFNDLNTSWGYAALANNNTGHYNTGIGANALGANTTGSSNTANGYVALTANNTGNYNTANGDHALYFNTKGNYNTANGYEALLNNESGSKNTALGTDALYNNVTGSNNTALGSGADIALDGLTNATAIGYNAIVDASNKIRIGNAAVTKIEGQVLPTTPSDGRFKFNVREDVHGLDFIMKLRPITYQFDTRKLEEQMSGKAVSSSAAVQASYQEATAIRHTGFIAQEVEKAAGATGYNFTGINKPASDKDHYSLSYESFIMPLVKAVQEQQGQIQEQHTQMDKLAKENAELKEKLLSQGAESRELKEILVKMQAAFKAQQELVENQIEEFKAGITKREAKDSSQP